MSVYARIDESIVVEFFETDGDISTMFHPDWLWVNVTEKDVNLKDIASKDEQGGWSFSKPPEPVVDKEIVYLNNKSYQNLLLKQATIKIDTLTDSLNTDIVDVVDKKDPALLTKWRQYRVLVNKINLQELNPIWPNEPE